MMQWLSDSFAPGGFFAPVCVVFLLILPLIWIRWKSPRRHGVVRFGTLAALRPQPSALLGENDRGLSHAAGWASRVRFILPLLRTLAVLALIFALARPQAGGSVREQREGIAVQMVLDVSGSMREKDFQLDGLAVRRIDAVKRVFRDFVLGAGDLSGRPNDLVGMTSFAMYADTRCPLTLDHANLVNLLDETEIPGWVDGTQVFQHEEANYTSIGDAIVAATDELRRAGDQAALGISGAKAAKSRVMILLTDGENNPPKNWDSPEPAEAAAIAGELGIKIYTIGAVGSAIMRLSSGVFSSGTGQIDERSLKRIAESTGGKFFRATDTASLKTIYEEIDQLERRITGEREFHDDTWASSLAMMIGLGLLMTELLLVNTRFRRIP